MSAVIEEFGPGQRRLDTQTGPAQPELVPGGQAGVDTQNCRAPGGDTIETFTEPGQVLSDAHLDGARLGEEASATGETIGEAKPTDAPSRRVADAILLLHADVLDDLEGVRIATENRLRSLTSVEAWGKGVNPLLPEVAVLESELAQLQDLEHHAELVLKRAMRAHPLGPWVKQTVGVGEKQAARLLAAIGDPAERKTVSQLWAFCGLHVLVPGGMLGPTEPIGSITASAGNGHLGDQRSLDAQSSTVAGVAQSFGGGQCEHATQRTFVPADSHPGDQGTPDAQSSAVAGVAPSRRKGQRANWSTTAKMRVFLVAESCIKQARSPYRAIYEAGREKYRDAVHVHPCARCGPVGRPAQPGSPLSAGHQHARAVRLVMKAILRDLWVEARGLT